MEYSTVTVLTGVPEEIVRLKMTDRKPLLIRNWDIGSCVKDWTSEYVSNKVGSEPVKIHVAKDEKMDFINKNFIYKTLPFDELIRRVFRYKQEDYFVDPFEKYYMRSLGNDPRGRDVANFFLQCRTLAEDLNVPPFYDEKDFFSSVFRASSQGVQLWTHYDIMDNILIQVSITIFCGRTGNFANHRPRYSFTVGKKFDNMSCMICITITYLNCD